MSFSIVRGKRKLDILLKQLIIKECHRDEKSTPLTVSLYN